MIVCIVLYIGNVLRRKSEVYVLEKYSRNITVITYNCYEL